MRFALMAVLVGQLALFPQTGVALGLFPAGSILQGPTLPGLIPGYHECGAPEGSVMVSMFC